VILSGRRINDGMGCFVAQKLVKMLASSDLPVRSARVGILGFTFKENVPDIRNSKVIDIYEELRAFGLSPMVHDPLAAPGDILSHYGVELSALDQFRDLHALILAVPHDDYADLDAAAVGQRLVDGGIFIDIKSKIDPAELRDSIRSWSL
jgi:UDP-N-acetyl-D-galactosamine dehydrogenase